ncbi:MAG: ABC transporter ATP-binding protein [Proteobacteria bacterium]|nr:ABC transporter ATP-binding protein [Pseudomonadota bacterium]
MTAPDLLVRNLTKRFASASGDLTAVADVSFEVAPGEFFTLLGPSGCGKTTTLRMVAGLEAATSGEIRFRGLDYTKVPARQRNIGMVFQSYALFPHLSVFDNVAYGLRQRRVPGPALRERVFSVLELLQLDLLADRLPSSLSGGQQQRVSIARALVYEPGILLLDEPLANLDAKLRLQMREEIHRLQRRLGIMVLYVTHDQEEAMAISDRVAVFNQGRLVQVDHPARVYSDPTSLFVADFIGKANFLPAIPTERHGGEVIAILPSGTPVTVRKVMETPPDPGHVIPDGSGILMVRPERVRLHPSNGILPGRVQRIQFLGNVTRYTIDVDQGEFLADLPRPLPGVGEGSTVCASFDAEDAILYVRTGA